MATLQTTKARSLLKVSDLDASEFERLLDSAEAFKEQPDAQADALRGRTVAMFFEKPSTRTRSSFAAAAYRLGGVALSFPAPQFEIGGGEANAGTAPRLSAVHGAVII